LNPEPTELIGSGSVSDMGYVREVLRAVKSIDPSILVEQAAGITTAQQVYDFIMAGSEAAGSASGILNSADPHALLNEMVHSVKRAREDLAKRNG
jgi:triosephosphate isomerase